MKKIILIIIYTLFWRNFLRIFIGLKYFNNKSLRNIKQFILIANHNSHMDTMALMSAIPSRFIHRVYSKIEIEKSEGRFNRFASYAKRFAAKEACSKALGTGFRKGVFMRDLSVINLSSGKPTMHLNGGALNRIYEIIPLRKKYQIDLSITDEPPYASAFVIISIY